MIEVWTNGHVEDTGLRSDVQIARREVPKGWIEFISSEHLFVRMHPAGALQIYVHKDLLE